LPTEHLLIGIGQDSRRGGAFLARPALTTRAIYKPADGGAGLPAHHRRHPRRSIRPQRYAKASRAGRKGKLRPVIGRDEEIRRVPSSALRRTKNNPCHR